MEQEEARLLHGGALHVSAKLHLLAQHNEMQLVGTESKDNQISIQAIEAVTRVGVEGGLSLHVAYVVHYLVLPLAGCLLATEYDPTFLPEGILRDFRSQKAAQAGLQSHHELCARRNAVAIESFMLTLLATLPCLRLQLLRLAGRAKAPAALLIHFGTWCDTIYGQEKQLLRLDQVEELVDVVVNVLKDLRLLQMEVDITIIRVRAVVDNPVHVQVEIVELRNLRKRMGLQCTSLCYPTHRHIYICICVCMYICAYILTLCSRANSLRQGYRSLI